ncbi:hypothetical protein FALBO_7490 [Fusarium albosuccineum]|uniref:Uncharacterized protein n=1 Tax=Fusarium albosuccineum TaxID=1237068 RepID=A0A8H4LCW1_9HYPO|nr:hypothetical protein FALBO_7490 [Fusarium albosuccineum]
MQFNLLSLIVTAILATEVAHAIPTGNSGVQKRCDQEAYEDCVFERELYCSRCQPSCGTACTVIGLAACRNVDGQGDC